MESDDDSRKKMDLHAAVRHLPEHNRINNGARRSEAEEEESTDQEENRLLSRIPSQRESSERDAHTTCSTKCHCGAPEGGGHEEIERELRAVKRQNTITHCLLSLLIIATAAWQISEVSLLLSAKEKLCNPLKAAGDLIRNSVLGRGKKFVLEGSPLPPIEVPQVPFINPLPPSLLPRNGDEH
ncbi:hypothetical protein KSP40_PGU011726 [Platanthera guangdongensis]|uniref:Uncharacterized protein n=1 Tax=Platanthera guangdongensis TaxID=2320717 RepID=A0ABR2MEV4_9ASPA